MNGKYQFIYCKGFKTIIILIFIIIGVIYFYKYNPAESLYPPCPFYYLTGFYCPGCGSSRAVHNILHGRFLKALDLNPLMVLSIPFVLYLFISEIQIGKKFIIKRPVFNLGMYIFIIGLIIVYWILRNVPVFPFTILAP